MGRPSFDLIERLRFDPEEGLVLLDRHLARVRASAAALGFAFDRHAAANELHAATFRRLVPSRVLLRLSPGGAIAIEVRDLPSPPAGPLAVAIVPLPVPANDIRLSHKTSDRCALDQARLASGRAEVLFERPDGLLTDGSVANLFVARDGKLVTPPLALGLMPGVLRAELIDGGEAIEAPLTRTDLADGFLIGNALMGLMPARIA